MKLIYIAGKYSDDTYELIDANILVARNAAIQCIKKGWFPITPHLMSAHFECSLPDIPNEFYYEGDFKLLNICHAILMLDNFLDSTGALGELDHANDNDITVYMDIKYVPHLGPPPNFREVRGILDDNSL